MLCGQIPVTAHINGSMVRNATEKHVSGEKTSSKHLLLPVVPDDGCGQHAREQPAKLSQSVQEWPVICFHIGVLQESNVSRYHRRAQKKQPLWLRASRESQ